MTIRNRVLVISLWLSVLALTTWFGGTLYQMLVIVPLWNASPPESVRAFFQGTDYNHTIIHLFGPPFILARNLPVVALCQLPTRFRAHRWQLGNYLPQPVQLLRTPARTKRRFSQTVHCRETGANSPPRPGVSFPSGSPPVSP